MSKKELYQVTFECEVITPMFLGNANPREAELRPPSIKGAMRFWWRAMNGHLSIEDLRTREGEIFGSSAGTGTKSSFLLTVDNPDGGITNVELPEHRNIPTVFFRNGREIKANLDSITFFAYGKDKSTSEDGKVAKYISVGTKFKVNLISYIKESILEAANNFRVLSYFGALGGKSRNGFGSFRIITERVVEGDVELPIFVPGNLFKHDMLTDFPAFSSKGHYCEYKNLGKKWDEAVSKMALKYALAKKEMKKIPGIQESDTFPNKKELVGGLGKKKGKVRLNNAPERIPKPYFLKFAIDESGQYYSRILYLPSKFLEGQKNGSNNVKFPELQREFLEYTEMMYKNICQKDVEELI